jgi:hypothetical protein
LTRRAEDAYFNRVLLQRLHATVLLLRFGDRLGETDRRVLDRAAAGEDTLRGVLDYMSRAFAERTSETLGYHRESARGVLWGLSWRLPLRRRPSTDLDRGVHPASDIVRYRGAPVGFEG